MSNDPVFSVWYAWRDLDGSEGLGKQTGQNISVVQSDLTFATCKDYLRTHWPTNEYQELTIVHNPSGRLMSYVL